jgi:hypothetical protein
MIPWNSLRPWRRAPYPPYDLLLGGWRTQRRVRAAGRLRGAAATAAARGVGPWEEEQQRAVPRHYLRRQDNSRLFRCRHLPWRTACCWLGVPCHGRVVRISLHATPPSAGGGCLRLAAYVSRINKPHTRHAAWHAGAVRAPAGAHARAHAASCARAQAALQLADACLSRCTARCSAKGAVRRPLLCGAGGGVEADARPHSA